MVANGKKSVTGLKGLQQRVIYIEGGTPALSEASGSAWTTSPRGPLSLPVQNHKVIF